MSDRSNTPNISSAGGRRTRIRALGVGGAVLAAVVIWTVAVPILGVDLRVTPGTDQPQDVGVGSVVVVSLAASLAGWGLLALLERFTSRGTTIWTVVALVVLVVSLLGALAGVTTATTVTLALLHLVVGTVLIVVLARVSTSS